MCGIQRKVITLIINIFFVVPLMCLQVYYKNTSIGKLHAVKIAKSVFLYVFTMAFPMSPFGALLNLQYMKIHTENFPQVLYMVNIFHLLP